MYDRVAKNDYYVFIMFYVIEYVAHIDIYTHGFLFFLQNLSGDDFDITTFIQTPLKVSIAWIYHY